MKIKCIIVDDEPLSRDILIRYIADSPSLELVSICKDAFEAIDALQKIKIDLIFLDINMPKLSGTKMIKSLLHPPMVIFTTAYPEFAVEGFELDAVDYLVKPFSFERFIKSVNKASEIYNLRKQTGPANVEPYEKDQLLFVKADKKIYKIMIENILYIQSYGDYVKIHTPEKTITTYDTLKNLGKFLPSRLFIRIHKSYIASLKNIQFIEGNQVNISGEKLPIGLSYKQMLMERLKDHSNS